MFLQLFYPSYIEIPPWRKEEQGPLQGAAQYVPEIKTSYVTWFENTKEDNIRKIIVWSDQQSGKNDLLQNIRLCCVNFPRAWLCYPDEALGC